MGGYGSGRWHDHQARSTLETCVAIDLRQLRAYGFFAKSPAYGILKWIDPATGQPLATVGFGLQDLAPDRRSLGIGYVLKHKRPDEEKEKVIEVFVLEATPPPPPTRWHIQCAGCERRVVAVYLAPGRDRFRCHHCHHLRHHSVQHHDARIDRIRRGDFLPEPTPPSRSIVWSMLNLHALSPRPIQRPILRIEVLDEEELEEELVSDSQGVGRGD